MKIRQNISTVILQNVENIYSRPTLKITQKHFYSHPSKCCQRNRATVHKSVGSYSHGKKGSFPLPSTFNPTLSHWHSLVGDYSHSRGIPIPVSAVISNVHVYCTCSSSKQLLSELSMGWVDPWVGLAWIGSGWVDIFRFLVGWVGLGAQ